MEKEIYKIGAIILKDKKILVVRKIVSGHTEFIIPGGRLEPGEKPIETLKRELKEELSVELQDASFFGRYEDIAIFEQIPIIMDVFFVTYEGSLLPASEIKEYAWVSKNYLNEGYTLGTVLSKHLIPELVLMEKM